MQDVIELSKSRLQVQRVAALCGPVMIVLFVIGFWVFARFVPPPSPALSAQEVADIFRERHTMILIGLTITSVASPLLAPFFAGISLQLKRIEGDWGILSLSQLVLGSLGVLVFLIPLMMLDVAAFRPEHSIESIQLINDLGWIPFVGMVWTFGAQNVLIGVAILRDQSPNPAYPRWAGYYNLLEVGLLMPGTLLVFFKTGPLAWDGLLSFWLAAGSFSIWVMVMGVLTLRATRRQEVELISGSVAGQGNDLQAQLDLLRADLTNLRQDVKQPS